MALGISVRWAIIEDLRTSLRTHSIDVDLMREILGEVA